MFSGAEEHVLYQIANAPVREYPYAHLYVENVFPGDFYAALRANWPDLASLTSLADTGRVSPGSYRERFVLPFTPEAIDRLPGGRREFWAEFGSWLIAERFLTAMIDKFEPYVKQRFGDDIYRCGFAADSLIVRDLTNFSIGPHTDAPHRLLSMLFYCPDDDALAHLGTSIYVPRDEEFRCAGGPHYPHANFRKVTTMEYRPNTLFAFIKNERSFHGVEPIGDRDVQRDILLYDIRVHEPQDAPARPSTRLGARLLKRLFGAGTK